MKQRRSWHIGFALGALGLALALLPALAGSASAGSTAYVSPGTTQTGPSPMPFNSCSLPNFNTIQAAVNLEPTGTTIVVCPGTYTEQVTISGKALTLNGSNATIQAPAVLTADLEGKKNVVDIRDGSNVTMSGFVVAGPGPGDCGSIDTGIAVLGGSSLDISFSTVKSIRDDSLSGCQNGEGIRVGTPRYATTADVGHATIDNVVVKDYQKNGIVIAGAGSTGKITNSTTTGAGPTDVIGQNGVEVVDGAAATVTTNIIRDDYYSPKGTTACGILVIGAGGFQQSQNTFQGDEQNKCVNSGTGGTFKE